MGASFRIIALTPTGLLDPSVAIAASRAGELGVLSLDGARRDGAVASHIQIGPGREHGKLGPERRRVHAGDRTTGRRAAPLARPSSRLAFVLSRRPATERCPVP